jgi:hypothetical protein
MSDIVITQRELLIAVVLAALFYLLLMLFGILRSALRRSTHTEPTAMPATQPDRAAIEARLDQFDQRLARLEASLGTTTGDEIQADDPVYGPAVRLIKDGMPVDDVAGRLGLSRAEVDLIAVLHRRH